MYNPESEENPLKEIEVTISVTLSKTTKIYVSDYKMNVIPLEDDMFPEINYDYSNCDLKRAVEEQIMLPQDKFEDWQLDDFEVIQE